LDKGERYFDIVAPFTNTVERILHPFDKVKQYTNDARLQVEHSNMLSRD